MTPPAGDCEDEVARAEFRAHEALCAERYRRIEESIQRFEKAGDDREAKIDGINNLLRVVAGFIIVTLMGVCGYLIDKLLG